jgi:hypothetical protein
LHGNIATYVCNADGNVLDILPGAYDPATYLTQLEQLRLLSRWVAQGEDSLERLREYHRDHQRAPEGVATLRRFRVEEAEPVKAVPERMADFSKVRRIERPVEVVLQPVSHKPIVLYAPAVSDSKDTTLTDLEKDASYNELVRRCAIHEHLAAADWTAPAAVTKWLYREVLNADLDDPYLGLKDLLFADYPFTDEAR